jgi:hypothetical protein
LLGLLKDVYYIIAEGAICASKLRRGSFKMDVYAYVRMRPLYEAMTVCSVTIGWLDGREKERNEAELQNALSKLVQVIEEFT